jgi:hypothetical protein
MVLHTPLRCAYSAMTNDPIAAKIILLNTGNYPSYSSYLNESWTFSSGDWTNVSPTLVDAGGPLPGRTDHVMAFDGSNVILYGGHDSIGQMLQDTWLWNGLTWAKQSPVAKPFGRYKAQATYLPGTGIMMFGGENLGNLLNETWIWNGSNWSQVSHANTSAASPSGRTGHVMASNAPGAPLSLGGATSFAVLGASTVTNTGSSVITGDLGLYPGTSITGFPPGTVIGTIHDTDAAAQAAQTAANATFTAGNALPGAVAISADIGGQTLTPGVYRSATSLAITGTLVLDGQGNPNASWIFQIGVTPSTLTTAAGNSVVSLINGASAANIFWLVGSSATLGTNTTFKGTIIAQASVTATTGAGIVGRLFALTGAVTLDTNTVSVALSPGPSTIQTILFGGRGQKGQSNTTWSFSGTTWTQLFPATSPSIRSEACMAFDSANGKWVMFGGQNEYGYLNETWTFDGTNWTKVAVPNGTGPAGHIGAQMAFDAGSNRTIMYGGISAKTNYPSNSTWSFNGATGVWSIL